MIEPYVYFNGNAEDAIEFYEKVFNCKDKKVMHYKDAPTNPEYQISEEMKGRVLHSEMTIEGTKFHFSDASYNMVSGNNISFAVTYDTPEQVKEKFNALKEGGEVLMELAPQFFSPMYGWVKDKFGTGWQIISK